MVRGPHFARGEWGGEWHPDFAPKAGYIVAKEHWSGWQKGITHVIVVGLLANTRIETTAHYAPELGYHLTLVRDATAALWHDMMHAAHELSGPTCAHAIMGPAELIAALSASHPKETRP
ncbi:cysteine hydrolase [Phyllobacterium sp. BT25]|uniref:Cysteine hydrolase n=1 Tax=Phyllobacterium pellucidum TaxID=2740464 RepID=A0A849VWG9_9HYPH|nr:cysteine hydrolase [Phyllobacterium pellucidum]